MPAKLEEFLSALSALIRGKSQGSCQSAPDGSAQGSRIDADYFARAAIRTRRRENQQEAKELLAHRGGESSLAPPTHEAVKAFATPVGTKRRKPQPLMVTLVAVAKNPGTTALGTKHRAEC